MGIVSVVPVHYGDVDGEVVGVDMYEYIFTEYSLLTAERKISEIVARKRKGQEILTSSRSHNLYRWSSMQLGAAESGTL